MNYFHENQKLHFTFPIDGDFVNPNDGKEENGALTVSAKLFDEAAGEVFVNGIKAKQNGNDYICTVKILPGENILKAYDENGNFDEIRVYFVKKAHKRFRISSDDNILLFADLTKHNYKSIFENPYLAVYKKAHDLYGAVVHLNIYEKFDRVSAEVFKGEREDFDLSMMTDRYKSEWEANSDWLRLSFHAKKNDPPDPYMNSDAKEVFDDAMRVNREIIRFAGEKTLSAETTLHYGSCTAEGTAALRKAGYKALAGFFVCDGYGVPSVSYHYPANLVNYLSSRDFWYDKSNDIVFCKVDYVLNWTNDPQVIVNILDGILKENKSADFISMLMHEEYFYTDYVGHLTEFENLVLTGAKWCFEHGYTGSDIVNAIF